MKRVCSACAKPLKEKTIMHRGKPTTVFMCKSPICKKYGVPQ